MPGLVKIGRTDRCPDLRARELSSQTGVPGLFELLSSWEVSDSTSVEKRIHKALSDRRVSGEFFRHSSDSECVNEVMGFLILWGELDADGRSYTETERIEKAVLRREEADRKAKAEYEESLEAAVKEWEKIKNDILIYAVNDAKDEISKERSKLLEDAIVMSLVGLFFVFTVIAPIMAYSTVRDSIRERKKMESREYYIRKLNYHLNSKKFSHFLKYGVKVPDGL